jgi:DNA primase
MIKPHVILNLQSKYEYIITLFDNDKAGIKAMNKYKNSYGIDGITLPLAKDLSDSIKMHGHNSVHEMLRPLIKKCINV